MTTVVHVVCYGSASLREKIVKDERLSRYGLQVSRQKISGRNPGWAKLHAVEHEIFGAINLEWDGPTKTLLARVVTRGRGKPDAILGRYIAYLLARHRHRIRSIEIHPD